MKAAFVEQKLVLYIETQFSAENNCIGIAK